MASAKAEIGDGGVGRGRRDIVAQRLTSSGRLVSFIATDLIPGLVETGDSAGGGAHGIEGTGGTEPGNDAFIRLGLLGANNGWSVTWLLAVLALARRKWRPLSAAWSSRRRGAPRGPGR